jgi:two-component system NtrC family response regulator
MAFVAIIDDDQLFCDMLATTVDRMEHQVSVVHTLEEARQFVTLDTTLDAVFLDVSLPDGNGLNFLPGLKDLSSDPEVIIVTGLGDPDGAELAIKSGAWDYIEKGSSIKEISLSLMRALQYREKKGERRTPMVFKRGNIVGDSPRMSEVLDLAAQASTTMANILITGETGTGKGLLARTIHDNSPRANNNFVVVDCTALPETLTESLLFGYEKGAFTGADKTRDGLIKQAHKGTLFLDEVGELPLNVQKSFLRVLQEHRFRPLSSNKEVEVDFALIAATNRNLDDMVKAGRFREDLLFRLKAFSIVVPPLKERPDDIPDLAIARVNEVSRRYGMATKGFSPEFIEALTLYTWPGNVRELFNCLDTALASAGDEPTLYPAHLPAQIRISIARASLSKPGNKTPVITEPKPQPPVMPSFRDAKDEFELKYLNRLMERVNGNVSEACRVSGLSRTRVYQLLKKHHVTMNA